MSGQAGGREKNPGKKKGERSFLGVHPLRGARSPTFLLCLVFIFRPSIGFFFQRQVQKS